MPVFTFAIKSKGSNIPTLNPKKYDSASEALENLKLCFSNDKHIDGYVIQLLTKISPKQEVNIEELL